MVTCANAKLIIGPLPFVGEVQIRTNAEDFTASRLLGKAPGTTEPPKLEL